MKRRGRKRGYVREGGALYGALPPEYARFLEDVKSRIRTAQVRAVLAANREMILLYWEIGRLILERQSEQAWGAKVVARLATDLRREFPEMRGLSPRNLLFMRGFAEAFSDLEIVKQLVSLLPWGHVVRLIQLVKEPSQREWYARAAVEHGWSRNVLVLQIETGLHQRQGKALTNFPTTLPAPQSDLAQQAMKDPYVFDFLTLHAQAKEKELEQGLLDHIQKFMLELGVGFTFVGRQFHLEVGGEDYYLDLLFYHLKLRCFVVIDLKIGAFKPEDAGKMNFYLSAVDDQLRHADDQPTIGLLLCREKDRLTVEYALRDVKKPIGVAQWRTRLVESLPKRLQGQLPTVEEIEAELQAGKP